MIKLGYEGCLSRDMLLVEVKNEAEAFAEIRRYLEVNNIQSDNTLLLIYNATDENGRIIEEYKTVDMGDNARFTIRRLSSPYYNTIAPESDYPRTKMGETFFWSDHRRGRNGDIIYWRDDVNRYLDDLRVRKLNLCQSRKED